MNGNLKDKFETYTWEKKVCSRCKVEKSVLKFKRRGLYQKQVSDICKGCDEGGNK